MKSLKLLLTNLFLMFGSVCLAQPTLPPPPDAIPINQGVIILIIGALAIGIYLIIKRRKRSNHH